MLFADLTGDSLFVKICGITNEQDALLSVALGANALGFVFANGSKRQVNPLVAADIIKRLPDNVAAIGVFKDESPERVVELVFRTGLSGAQLHGQESVANAQKVAQSVPIVIKAFPSRSIDLIEEYPFDVCLIDANEAGSGKTFDWSLLSSIAPSRNFILAGGLDPDNVFEAVTTTRCFGVDVSSGVESSFGQKDPVKLRRFIANARQAGELRSNREDANDKSTKAQRMQLARRQSVETSFPSAPGQSPQIGLEHVAPYDFEKDFN